VIAALALSGAIGLSLGLVGGGGSIITMPVLVYVAGLPPREAVAVSLAIVGATAAVGAALNYRTGGADLRLTAIFGATGMAGALVGAPLTRLAPGPVLMLLFAALMFFVGVRMLGEPATEENAGGKCDPVRCLAAGFGLGVLTGFLGVGGGFLIVPALLRFARAPMRVAVGTSLSIIALNSAAGFAAHAAETRGLSLLVAAFTGVAVIGLVGGVALGRRMKPAHLKRAFAGLALGVAAYLVVMNVRPLLGLWAG
jgi:uncharacterized membrane protein YfcA